MSCKLKLFFWLFFLIKTEEFMLVKCIIKYFEIIFSGQFTLKAENAHPLAVSAMKSMIYSIGNSLEVCNLFDMKILARCLYLHS